MTAFRELNVGGNRRPTSGRARGRPRLGDLAGKIRRRVSLTPFLVGALALVLAVVGISTLVSHLGGVTEVWVAADDIQPNRPLTVTDVEAVPVAGVIEFEHLEVTETSREELLLLMPRVEVPAGTPLSTGQFHPPGGFQAVEPGSVTVAVVLSRSRVPDGVTEGDTVLLIGVPGSSSAAAVAGDWPGSAPLEAEATVVTITEYSSGSDLALTVAVPADIADDAAWLAAENRLVVAHVR